MDTMTKAVTMASLSADYASAVLSADIDSLDGLVALGDRIALINKAAEVCTDKAGFDRAVQVVIDSDPEVRRRMNQVIGLYGRS